MTNRTFTMLKPDAVEKGHVGAILEKINASGFRIVALKLTHMTTADAKAFYAVHSERPFYGELVEFMSSGPIVAAVLEKENAVEDFRTLIGATNPAEAAEGTIRKISLHDKSGKELMSFPLTIGVVGALVAPVLAAIGAIAALVGECTLTVEREEEKTE